MKTTKTTLILFVFLLVFWSKSYSDDYNLSNPLFPSVNTLPEQSIGGFIGVGPNWQGGTHYVDCSGCEFIDGTATGFTIGALYQRKFAQNFYWGGMISVDIMGIESAYRERESIEINEPKLGTQKTTVNINFRHNAELSLTYLGFAPYLLYNPVGWLTLRGAPKFSFPISSNVIHSKELIDNNISINGIDYESDKEKEIIQDSEFPDLTSPLFGADLSLMLNVTPSDKTTLSFGYTQYVPFTETSSFGDNFVINSWRFVVEFKYTLKEAYDSRPKSAK